MLNENYRSFAIQAVRDLYPENSKELEARIETAKSDNEICRILTTAREELL